MARSYSFGPLEAEYASRWDAMRIKPGKVTSIDAVARKIIAGKARYQAVEAETGVPWAFIGVLHNREAGCDFAGVLHNGEKIIGTGRKTKLVPAGRGPFSSWHAAALDALKIKGYKIGSPTWSIARCLFEGERFNGFGYRNQGVPSAYLWSFSDQYAKGKYIADHVWSATAVDQQMGIAPLMARLMVLDPDVKFGEGGLPREWATSPKPEPTAPVPADGIDPDDGLDKGEIEAIQNLLRDRQYFSVGSADGKWGPKTVGALAQFQSSAGLPVTVSVDRAWVDKTTIAALATAPSAKVSEERAKTTVEDLQKAGDPAAAATWWTKFSAQIAALFSSLFAAVFGASSKTSEATGYLAPVKEFLGDIPVTTWFVLVAVVAGAIWWNTKRTEKAMVQNVRSGRDAGPA